MLLAAIILAVFLTAIWGHPSDRAPADPGTFRLIHIMSWARPSEQRDPTDSLHLPRPTTQTARWWGSVLGYDGGSRGQWPPGMPPDRRVRTSAAKFP